MRGERTIAHIWSTTTIHVRRDRITSRKTEIRELDDDFALTDTILVEGPTIGDNEILRLDVTMKHGRIVAGSYGLTHLGKHGGDKAETFVGQQLRRVKGGKEPRCGWSMGQRRIGGRIDVVMIAGLFQKIE